MISEDDRLLQEIRRLQKGSNDDWYDHGRLRKDRNRVSNLNLLQEIIIS